MEFSQLALIEPILKALNAEGYTNPTPIQEQAIPILLERKDLLGCAQTGTGKTAAFAIPILQILQQQPPTSRGPGTVKTLVLTPTRELAIQIDESFAAYGKFCKVSHTVIFGGVSQHSQVQALRRGIDVLIATPGRLLDLMSQGYIDLRYLEIFVLDEADRMLDMGFIHDVKKVITKLPAKRQTLFFSATMPPEIQQLANALLHNPSKVEVTPVSSTVDAIEQRLYYVDKGNKPSLLLHMLEDTNIKSALVFTRTKHGADKLVKILQRERISAAAIHGNKSQNNRQSALLGFKTGELRVLVATDIAARGIDIDALGYVVNYELPDVPETYVHRIGRTGRAGATGIALTFCDAEERIELRDIQRLIGKSIPVIDSHPFPAGSHVTSPQVGASVQRPFVQRGNGGQQNRNSNNSRNGNSQGNRPQRTGGQQRQDRSHSGRPQPNRSSNNGQQRQGNAYNSQHSSAQRSSGNQQPAPERTPWQQAQPAPRPQPQVGNIDLGEVERW